MIVATTAHKDSSNFQPDVGRRDKKVERVILLRVVEASLHGALDLAHPLELDVDKSSIHR